MTPGQEDFCERVSRLLRSYGFAVRFEEHPEKEAFRILASLPHESGLGAEGGEESTGLLKLESGSWARRVKNDATVCPSDVAHELRKRLERKPGPA